MVYQIRLAHQIGAIGFVVIVDTNDPEVALRSAIQDYHIQGRPENPVVLEMKPHEGRVIEVADGKAK